MATKTKLLKTQSLPKNNSLGNFRIIFQKSSEFYNFIISTESYKCTGKFKEDFENICGLKNLKFTPEVVSRSKPLENGVLVTASGEQPFKHKNLNPLDLSANKQQLQKIKNGKSTKANQEFEVDINGGEQQSPKTFVIKESYDYYKPKINVEMTDNSDLESVYEIIIKGWKIEKPIMETLNCCLPYISCLNTIKYVFFL
jgi:hypothetical protein